MPAVPWLGYLSLAFIFLGRATAETRNHEDRLDLAAIPLPEVENVSAANMLHTKPVLTIFLFVSRANSSTRCWKSTTSL